MKIIRKVNLFENTVEEISMFDSPLTRKFDAMGVDTNSAIIKICAECPKKEDVESSVKATLSHYAASGFMLDGIVYDPFMAGASDARKATSSWVNRDLIPELGKWAMCGLQTKDMRLAINKYMAYIGLLSSASKPFVDVFGKKIDVRRVAVIKDCYVKVLAKADVASMGSVEHDVDREVEINAFDGLAVVRKELTNGEAFTGRGAPWWKFLAIPMNFELLKRWNETFIDYWGNVIKIDDVDLILTESCFKTVKLYKDFNQYQTAFEELGHEIYVCVREHKPHLKGLPYQQGQTLMGNKDDAVSFMQHAKSTVYKYHEPKKAASLLYGDHAKAAKMYPALLTESFTKKSVQEKYTTKRNDMLGGRIPELGYNAFLAPDPVAFAQHLFGKAIKGFLKAGECYCTVANEGFVDVTRNPHLDNAHVVLNNVKSCPLAEGPTMFINIMDMTTIRLRADYDGDHVWYSQDKHLLDLVNRTYEQLGNLPIDWTAPSAPKGPITKSAIAEFITNLIHGSEIGLYADALTKMWGLGYDRDVCDWLTYAGNVLIDSAKHGSVAIVKPEAVNKLNFKSLPMFAMYAKANADRPAESDYWLKERVSKTGIVFPPRCKRQDCMLDEYSDQVKENIGEVLEVEGLEDLVFDRTVLMINPQRPIGNFNGLSKKGIYDPESNTFKECGLFQEIAFRHSREWNKLIGDTSFFANRREWEEETGRAARREIIDWAYTRYPEVEKSEEMDKRLDDACYDIITRNIFNTQLKGTEAVIMQAFWRIYGDKAVETLKANLNSEIPDFDDEEFEELFDIDEE